MNQTLRDACGSRAGTMLRHVILFALCMPLYIADDSYYAPEFILVNFFALLFIGAAVLGRRIDWSRRSLFGWGLLALLVLMNVFALYYNRKYHGWYMGQVHLTVSFLTFVVLYMCRDGENIEDEGLVRFLLRMVIITNVIAIAVHLMGYWRVSFRGNRISFEKDWIGGYQWIYIHKSQYAFSLVLSLALLITYRRYFKSKWTFLAGMAVLLVDLALSDTYTSMAAAVFIFIGMLMDYVKRQKRFRLKYLLCLIPVAVVFLVLLVLITRNRSDRGLSTLGNRIPFWSCAVQVIKDFPAGFGARAGRFSFQELGYSAFAFNCHNVFLNWMFQYSLPAGLCCCAIFFTVVAVSVKRNPSFTTLGIWVALLLPMNMDWCVLPQELTMTLLCIYLIFFSPLRRAEPAAQAKEAAALEE